MMRRITFLICIMLVGVLLSACTGDSIDERPDEAPLVGFARIDGPLAGDVVNFRKIERGVPLVAASEQYDPITGATSANRLSVYVTVSEEVSVRDVELFVEGDSAGFYTVTDKGQGIGNPFIFPPPNTPSETVNMPGAPTGLVEYTLEAVVNDVTGLMSDRNTLQVRADGSRPELNFRIDGEGSLVEDEPFSGVITLYGNANDAETGIRDYSFIAEFDGEEIELPDELATNFVLQVNTNELESGSHSVYMEAFNNVHVRNANVFTFDVNQKPVAVDDAVETPIDTSVVIDVFANDVDKEGDSISVIDFTEPVTGTLEYLGNGFFEYTPPAGTAGTVSFVYVIQDSVRGDDRTDSARVAITIKEPEAEPPPEE